ncbi:hypothetical protein [Paraburkholderia mimosarum]|uniref:hypothetical protein n=1 Tax=Paraburkholderia mimosarum TaxID=312026 RepID=UPI000482D23B|nr:hypothetical protein [Paraburkholderia mimosarum]
MVTTPTLEQLAAWGPQQVFKHIASHLLTQGERCTKGHYPEGQYRNELGQACAVGCVIPEHLYRSSFEGQGIHGLVLRLACLPKVEYVTLAEFVTRHASLLIQLMDLHDRTPPACWPEALRDIGAAYGLDTQVVDLFSVEGEPRADQASHVMPERLKPADGASHVVS